MRLDGLVSGKFHVTSVIMYWLVTKEEFFIITALRFLVISDDDSDVTVWEMQMSMLNKAGKFGVYCTGCG